MKLPRPIRGIIPPILTPLADRDQLDGAAFAALLKSDSVGLFILGSTGEFPGQSGRLRREVIEYACVVAGPRPPLLMGGFGNGLMAEPYLALGKEKRAGIHAVLKTVGLLNTVVAP
jgi:4-hydroxy-tetrahydrodipicolinate synthase